MGQTAALRLTRWICPRGQAECLIPSGGYGQSARAESSGTDRLALPLMRASHGRKPGAAIERKGSAL